ncbi:hypothetical protein BSKO_10979 [Bryopsis sp. KO-2023]|nr:hypothetical protein BSKO_10979 [Bryopsis sp. KO-2023]
MDQIQAETSSDPIEPENYPVFRNIEGRTREERRANGKTVRSFKGEPNLVGKVCGGRLVEEPLHHPLFIVEGTPSHADDAARFERDTAAAEFEFRAEKLRMQEEYISSKRAEKWERETNRWAEIQRKQDAGEETFDLNRKSGVNAKKNVSGEHFNIVTLEYSPTEKGKHLEYLVRSRAEQTEVNEAVMFSSSVENQASKMVQRLTAVRFPIQDDCQRYKDEMRARNLFSRSRSTSHNIITGELDPTTNFLSPPKPPTAPGKVA